MDTLEAMKSITNGKITNTGRQYNLDLLKVIAIVAMVICHSVTVLSSARPGYENELGYWMAENFFGAYLAVAHAFMFCMGVGFVYSKSKDPKTLFKRGLRIYILAYILNFARGTGYMLIASLFDAEYLEMVSYTFFMQDILHFAGLAMMITALFRKLKLDCHVILCISVVMSAVSQFVTWTDESNILVNALIGTFVPTSMDVTSAFTLCGWYVFVAVGICFGEILQRTENLKRFYKRLLCFSSVILVVYIAATVKNGCFFLSAEKNYYCASLAEAAGLLSIDFVLLSLMYFAVDKLSPKAREGMALQVCLKMSKNLNQIYIVHWCVIGLLNAVIIYLLALPVPYWVSYLLVVPILILSYRIADVWTKRRDRKPARG